MAAKKQGFHGPTEYEGKVQWGQSDQRPAWFDGNPTELQEEGRKLLEEYSHIEPGQELRFLRHNGQTVGEQLYGFDLELGFIKFGYDLFCDRDGLGATLLSGDLLAERTVSGSRQLNTLEGKIDVVHCSSVLHVWGWDQMLQVAKRLVSLTRPEPGSIIIGNQMRSSNPGEYAMPAALVYNYRHNEASIHEFWTQVGEVTGTNWKIESGMFMPPAVTENLKHTGSWKMAILK
ncbi:Fc.00g105300.m01.CDS01 [Cosmosporella sp. VM-42]